MNILTTFLGMLSVLFFILDPPLKRATYYNAVPEQTDKNYLTTASGKIIDTANIQRWVGLSRDLIYDETRQALTSDTTLWRGAYKFGDTIYVWSLDPELIGLWVVEDCMNVRYRRSIDFLLPKKGYRIGVLKNIRIYPYE
jgi:hypothetical protein